MPNAGHELVAWTPAQWEEIENGLRLALDETAKCRLVVPSGREQIGEKSVAVPTIALGATISYGPDTIATPVQIYQDAALDDHHPAEIEDVLRLVGVAAAQLGVLEDQEIIQGPPPAQGAAAGARAAAAARQARPVVWPGMEALRGSASLRPVRPPLRRSERME